VASLQKEGLSQRQACQVLRFSRAACRRVPQEKNPDLVAQIKALAIENPRYGYRRIWALLKRQEMRVNRKTVHRIWQREKLQVKTSQPKRKRAGKTVFPNQALCPNHVWTMDFVHDRLSNNSPLRMLTLVDEFTRECLDIPVKRSFKAEDVVETLLRVIQERGVTPLFIRSDNGSEFIAKALQTILSQVGCQSTFIEPGSPWQNGKCESFNGKFRDECLNMHAFQTLFEAKSLIRQWRNQYNQYRPHSSLGYLTPTEYAAQCQERQRAASQGDSTGYLPPAALSLP
jgi:putative transposase